ncbi:MAG TPA: MerR family DNA-binding protein, partial [Nevskiaceae bacterium]|nr:MerR family DNA-binding protein [Nevskiaceae bacterium]
RRASGYRAFPPETVERLRFIRKAKDLGFTLEEIAELLALSAQRDRGVKGVKASAESKLSIVEEKIRELERVRDGLRTLIKACPGHGPLEGCPILQALGG